jgi:hypothetical protein
VSRLRLEPATFRKQLKTQPYIPSKGTRNARDSSVQFVDGKGRNLFHDLRIIDACHLYRFCGIQWLDYCELYIVKCVEGSVRDYVHLPYLEEVE